VSTARDPIESGCWLTLIFPGFSSIIFLRRLFTWYFQRKLNKNGDKLSRLKEDKRKILEQVMDKETYKVAIRGAFRFKLRSKSKQPALVMGNILIDNSRQIKNAV